MKSGSAPVRSVPLNFKERPTAQLDPNAVTADGSFVQPIEAVLTTDAGGTEDTIQRDADGEPLTWAGSFQNSDCRRQGAGLLVRGSSASGSTRLCSGMNSAEKSANKFDAL